MAGAGAYYYQPPPPLVDNPHERSHQHQSYMNYVAHRHPDPESHPNYPDVDIRDTGTIYMIDIEVPGIRNPEDIHVQWTSSKTLVITGTTRRPADPESGGTEDKMNRHGGGHYLMVGERKIGYFRRVFNLPFEVEREKMTAHLEAGLLTLDIPKKGHEKVEGDGLVKVTSRG